MVYYKYRVIDNKKRKKEKMRLFNKTTKETIELTLIDPKTNNDWSDDFVLNAADDKVVYNEETEQYECDNETCEWWSKHCEEYQDADNAIDEWKSTADDEDVEYYEHYIGGVEFDELPSAMQTYIKEHPAPKIAQKEMKELVSAEVFEESASDTYAAIDNSYAIERLEYTSYTAIQDIGDQETWIFGDGSYITRNEDMYYTGDDITMFEIEYEAK